MSLSPAQVRNRLVLAARIIITDHWARAGRCPICRMPLCQAILTEYEYLEMVGERPYVPHDAAR
ncbi:hypothetical protein ABT214_05260 [Micromonospora purpureochromogenes]